VPHHRSKNGVDLDALIKEEPEVIPPTPSPKNTRITFESINDIHARLVAKLMLQIEKRLDDPDRNPSAPFLTASEVALLRSATHALTAAHSASAAENATETVMERILKLSSHLFGEPEIAPYLDAPPSDETCEEFQTQSDTIEAELMAQLEST
jgi:hypothetical protein